MDQDQRIFKHTLHSVRVGDEIRREITRYQYAASNRTQRTDYNGAVTNYEYDNLNRLTTITYPDTTTVDYGYDELSRLATATNANGTVTMTYDNRNRATSVAGVFGQTVSYGYDVAGNRTSMSIGGSNYAGYSYDTVNRLNTITDNSSLAVNYAYDATNKPTSRTLPNGITTAYDYDGLNRLTRLRHTTATATLTDNQYTYDTANRISQLTDLGGTHAYSYDSVDRVTSATYPGATSESYTYDGVGNRTASHLSGSYTYQPFNKVTSAGGVTYTYDNNGNLLTKVAGTATTQYTWDFENCLTQVTLPNGTVVNYKYDALGRRIQRTSSTGDDERYVYDGQNVVQDLDSSSSVVNSYLNGPGLDNHLRQTNATTGVSYFLTDHLGSMGGLTDSSANLFEQISYDSFGNHVASSRSRYTYTGRERDADTGLMYYRARSYDPQLGRFISEDPIGLTGGLNLYSYVLNNSMRFTDPTGTQTRSDRNWNEGEINPITGERLHNDMRQAAGMACALDGFNPWINLDVGAGFQLFNFAGANGTFGVMINVYTLEICVYTRVGLSPGFATGLYAGAGAQFGFAFGPSEGSNAGGPGVEGFVDAADGAGISGHAVGISSNSFYGGASVGPTVGWGWSGGLRGSYTKILYCINSPNCPCK